VKVDKGGEEKKKEGGRENLLTSPIFILGLGEPGGLNEKGELQKNLLPSETKKRGKRRAEGRDQKKEGEGAKGSTPFPVSYFSLKGKKKV